jgi:hypothetical protein
MEIRPYCFNRLQAVYEPAQPMRYMLVILFHAACLGGVLAFARRAPTIED